MAGIRFLCCSDARRAALQAHPELNGIDFLDVDALDPGQLSADEAAEYAALPANRRDRLLWQRRLTVTFVNPLLPPHQALLTADHLRLEGGERPDSRNIGLVVLSEAIQSSVLRASRAGDFSTYRLSLVTGPGNPEPPSVIDPLLSAVDFSFKVDCDSDFDCAPVADCPPVERPAIDLDYLTRDYASFRRLMLDRISTLVPDWQERHAPDLGIALVETVAYVADYLSYRQEAIATEAYLRTARKRVSVRRHARLVDYPMHDGCNARAWIQVVLAAGAPASGVSLPLLDPGSGDPIRFLTKSAAGPVLSDAELQRLLATDPPEVFELLTPATLFPEHGEIDFYTWGATECCLPQGATSATLAGRLSHLQAGDVLVFEEVRGPRTGVPGDADPAHRQAVRLTGVTLSSDPLGGRFLDPPTGDPVDVTEIEWSTADALAFPVCVSTTVKDTSGKEVPAVVSVARGNIVAADHGLSVVEQLAGPVPASRLARVVPAGPGCEPSDPAPIPARYSPQLGRGPLSQATAFDSAAPASSAARQMQAQALPQIRLVPDPADADWLPQRDLLRSADGDRVFVVEVESDGTASLRFGDDRHGLRPSAGTSFEAHYRVGNGLAGNVAADSIFHVVTSVAGIDHVRNPLPAAGGTDPEPIENVRRFAPVAFRTQDRAVTADDYAAMTQRHPQVQRAAATFRWTGSWRTVYVTADALAGTAAERGAGPFDPPLAETLEPYRMAGHDLDADTPVYVPLEIEMRVCAKPGYFRSDVRQALLEVFSSRTLADGRRGLFHPDNLTLGQPVYLSPLIAAARAVDGVDTATVVTFQRQGVTDPVPLQDGKLAFGRLEIPRLANDPSLPERGVFRLEVEGGK